MFRLVSSPFLQEAVHRESLESQKAASKENVQAEASKNLPPKKLSQSTLGTPLLCPTPTALPGTPPLSPASPHRPSSVHTHKHTFSQHSIPSRPSSRSSNPDRSLFESSDLADEEVSHINSAVTGWGEQLGSRDPSKSPFTSPAVSPAPLRNGSTTSLTMGNSKEKDLKKFYSVDTRGFLAKPSWADDQRRHSIEICPSLSDGDSRVIESPVDKRKVPLYIQSESEYIHGVRRKKKMSPPCISIDPPMEEESNASTRTKASENSLLRRRTPSCESTTYRDSLELTENQPGDQTSKAERRAPPACRGEHLTIPNFSFDQADASSLSGHSDCLSDSGQATPLPTDLRPDDIPALELKKLDHLKTPGLNLERSQEPLGGPKSPIRKHGLVSVIPAATDEVVDDPV